VELEERQMKTYTLDGVYEAEYANLMDKFLELYDRSPNIGEENEIIAEARQYAKDFIENLADWQRDRDRDDRNA
jgi:hypothetical protein